MIATYDSSQLIPITSTSIVRPAATSTSTSRPQEQTNSARGSFESKDKGKQYYSFLAIETNQSSFSNTLGNTLLKTTENDEYSSQLL
jgi:hypothetical protein